MIDKVKQRSNSSVDFFVHYQEICARYGLCPVKFSRAYMIDGVLDVNADRIRFEDWKPLLEALQEDRSLRCFAVRSFAKSTYGVEDSGNRKPLQSKRTVVLNADIVSNLCTSLAHILKASAALTSLTLQKIPLKMDHVQILKESIAASKNLQCLSLEQCAIGDAGIKDICIALKNVTCLEVLNFAECNLTWRAINDICHVIQYHGLMHHSDVWHASLRHASPQISQESGLRILTLNGNPGVGDRGTIRLAEALVDDLWLNELGLQNCGITDEGALALMKLLKHQTKAIVDIRGNPLQDRELLQKLNKTRDKENNTQLDKKQVQTSHHRKRLCSVVARVCSVRSNSSVITTRKEPEMKIPEDDQVPSISRKDRLSCTLTKPLETEEQLNMYKHMLEEEKAAHNETSKKLSKLAAENKALLAALKKDPAAGSYVDSTLLTQIEDTFLKLHEFLSVLKAADLERLLGPSKVEHLLPKDNGLTDKQTSSEGCAVLGVTDTTPFRMKESLPEDSDMVSAPISGINGQISLMSSHKSRLSTKTVQWTALQKHQAVERILSNSNFHLDIPSPDHVSCVTFDNMNWIEDEKSHKPLAGVSGLPGCDYASTQTMQVVEELTPSHCLETYSTHTAKVRTETKGTNWISARWQLNSSADAEHVESELIFNNRASGLEASDSSNNKQFPNQQKPSEISSSLSLTDILSEDEF